MFVVKASYKNETRRFNLTQVSFPTFDQLCSQLMRVFPTGQGFYLSKILFTDASGKQQLIADQVHSSREFYQRTAQLATQSWNYGKLRFVVNDCSNKETSSHLHPDPSPQHLMQDKAKSKDKSSPISDPTDTSRPTPCCSLHKGKVEIQDLMNNFLANFEAIMSTTFADNIDHRTEETNLLSTSDSKPPEIVQEQNPAARIEDIHPGIWCDNCGLQVRGIRYQCQECSQYNLCHDCAVCQNAIEVHVSNSEERHSFTSVIPSNHHEMHPSTADPPPELPVGQTYTGVICDICQKTIVGVRHKCLDCADYDLCENCISETPTVHPLHEFLKLSEPGRVVIHTVGDRTQRKPLHSATCDMCDSRIKGDRFKCTNCPDFDLCERCFVIAPEQHPTHIFVKIREPRDVMPGRTPAHSIAHKARCNACGEMIFGVRYKCTHPSCPDFDLCMNCEALPISVHPETHVFWKIKSNSVMSADLSLGHNTLQAIEPEEHLEATTPHQSLPKPQVEERHETQNVSHQPLVSENLTDATIEEHTFSAETVTPLVPDMQHDANASQTRPTALPELNAVFLSDNNMEDGVIIAPGAEFVKSWRMLNSGTIAWPDGTELVFIAGDRLGAFDGASNRFEVGAVLPGEAVDVWAADMKAPDDAGRYISHWSLQDPSGNLFGHRLWCDIVVPAPDKEASSHSGSVLLPTPFREETTPPLQGGIPQVNPIPESLLSTDPATPSRSINSPTPYTHHTEFPDLSIVSDSEESEIWDDAAVPRQANQDVLANEALAQALEYVVLYDTE